VARVHRSKNGRPRNVPLSEQARRVLADVAGAFDITVRQKDALFRKLCAKAGIEGLHFHDSRHTAITRLATKLTVLELARMVGHRDLNQLLVYYNESAEEIAKKL
jgi:integrase